MRKDAKFLLPAWCGLIAAIVIGHKLSAQDNRGWLISPENLSLAQGDGRILQLPDDSAQELHGGQWSINDPNLAEVSEDNGRLIVHSKKPGTVVVTAILHGERRTRDIVIWPMGKTPPPGTVTWSGHPIGRQLRDTLRRLNQYSS